MSNLKKTLRKLVNKTTVCSNTSEGEKTVYMDSIDDFEQIVESLLSKQRDLSELVEWKVSKTKEILLDFNGSDSNRLKAVATIIHSEKILEDQAINQVLSIIKDTNEVAEEEEENK